MAFNSLLKNNLQSSIQIHDPHISLFNYSLQIPRHICHYVYAPIPTSIQTQNPHSLAHPLLLKPNPIKILSTHTPINHPTKKKQPTNPSIKKIPPGNKIGPPRASDRPISNQACEPQKVFRFISDEASRRLSCCCCCCSSRRRRRRRRRDPARAAQQHQRQQRRRQQQQQQSFAKAPSRNRTPK